MPIKIAIKDFEIIPPETKNIPREAYNIYINNIPQVLLSFNLILATILIQF